MARKRSKRGDPSDKITLLSLLAIFLVLAGIFFMVFKFDGAGPLKLEDSLGPYERLAPFWFGALLCWLLGGKLTISQLVDFFQSMPTIKIEPKKPGFDQSSMTTNSKNLKQIGANQPDNVEESEE